MKLLEQCRLATVLDVGIVVYMLSNYMVYDRESDRKGSQQTLP